MGMFVYVLEFLPITFYGNGIGGEYRNFNVIIAGVILNTSEYAQSIVR